MLGGLWSKLVQAGKEGGEGGRQPFGRRPRGPLEALDSGEDLIDTREVSQR